MSSAEALVPWAQVASGIAASVSSLVACVTTIFVVVQCVRLRRTSALQALQEFTKTLTERERALVVAPDADGHRLAFWELLNSLETHAAAYNGRLYIGTAAEIVRDKLVDSLVIIKDSPRGRAEMDAAMNSDAVFTHLHDFRRRNHRLIDARAAARRQSRACD